MSNYSVNKYLSLLINRTPKLKEQGQHPLSSIKFAKYLKIIVTLFKARDLLSFCD